VQLKPSVSAIAVPTGVLLLSKSSFSLLLVSSVLLGLRIAWH